MNHLFMNLVACLFVVASVMADDTQSLHAEGSSVVPNPNVIFVTSVTGTGDLFTWADSPGIGGLIGADIICRARAAAAGLPDSTLFVAWLSDSLDDAYCRIHGATGTKASKCGYPDLPSVAGPWVRTDSHPFGTVIFTLLGGQGEVFVPALLDEFGATAPSNVVFTGTDFNGEFDGGVSAGCSNWSSAASLGVTAGSTLRTAGSWTDFGTTQCSGQASLLCMLPGNGPALMPLFNQGALAFVTSSTGTGRLEDWPEAGGNQGLAAADNICLLRALSAGLPHPEEFKAWLSTSAVDAADRFTFGGPWVRPDGVIVAQTKAELVSGQLHAPINQSVSGEYFGNIAAWTGSTEFGSGTGTSCLSWTSDNGGDTGTLGAANSVDQWSQVSTPSVCFQNASLYCLSNVPSAIRIFLDGFETGDPSLWSSTNP